MNYLTLLFNGLYEEYKTLFDHNASFEIITWKIQNSRKEIDMKKITYDLLRPDKAVMWLSKNMFLSGKPSEVNRKPEETQTQKKTTTTTAN